MRPMFINSVRVAYNNIRNLPLVDVAMSLRYLVLLNDEKKVQKFLVKLQNHIETTNPQLIKKPNQFAILEIMRFYRSLMMLSSQMTETFLSLLKTELKNKRW